MWLVAVGAEPLPARFRRGQGRPAGQSARPEGTCRGVQMGSGRGGVGQRVTVGEERCDVRLPEDCSVFGGRIMHGVTRGAADHVLRFIER